MSKYKVGGRVLFYTNPQNKEVKNKLLKNNKRVKKEINDTRKIKAQNLGKLYGEEILKRDEEVNELKGSGFWGDFSKGLSSVIDPVSDAVGYVPTPTAQAVSMGLKGVSEGTKALTKGKGVTGGKKKGKSSKWIEYVKKVSREEGIPYGEALKVASRTYKR